MATIDLTKTYTIKSMKPVRLIIIGAGSRGAGYSTFAEAHPEKAEIAAVAEPRDHYRNTLAATHHVAKENVMHDLREVLARPRFADAVIIATQDALHAEPAIALANKGYHILLEKPMAPNLADCCRIAESALRNRVLFAVCHVLRYTAYTRKLKEIVDAGALGEIVNIQHLEPVGYWHQAHSFVRGNWRNEAESSPMLLAKSCHDLDWIRYIMGSRCTAVSSFGTLKHFRKTEQPKGASDRCVDCAVEPSCPYSALRIYMSRVRRNETCWPVSILSPDVSENGIMEALRHGPYGRCVYACDNDVVDNQVVNMQFEGKQTASFTMTAFTEMAHRQTRIFGTRGQLTGDGRKITVFDFLSDTSSTVDTESGDGTLLSGHGGGDYGLMSGFIAAVAENNPARILSGATESLETHAMVFAAEQARRENRVVMLETTDALLKRI